MNIQEIIKKIEHILEECRIDMESLTYKELKYLRDELKK